MNTNSLPHHAPCRRYRVNVGTTAVPDHDKAVALGFAELARQMSLSKIERRTVSK
ncbi:hypothetical protein L4C54_19625 [Vibrio lamellibrachiae]|uniref:hypothetical protein n=1 Tax=Vibrio lamellibrachiae TaxID=2910253 RepID=UPI003D14E7AD